MGAFSLPSGSQGPHPEVSSQLQERGAGTPTPEVLDRVRAGDTIATLHTDTPAKFPAAMATLGEGVHISDSAPATRPLVVERITA